MLEQLDLGGVSIDLIRKDIKNVHLSVHPPTGRVRIAAPTRMSTEAVRLFAVSKIGWIRRHQQKLVSQDRESPREYLDRERHFVWGRRVLLRVVEEPGRTSVRLRHTSLVITAPARSDRSALEAALAAWYRKEIRDALPTLLARWQSKLGVRVEGVRLQRMKTRWGSCSPLTRTIRLNTELAKKPRECLEYVLVHELAHLLDASHGTRFIGILDRALPDWRETRELLNRLPTRYEPSEHQASACGTGRPSARRRRVPA